MEAYIAAMGLLQVIIGGMLAFIQYQAEQRAKQRSEAFQVRLAEIETRGHDAKLDGENVGNALALVSAVVTTFEPVKTFLQNLAERVDVKHDETQRIVTSAAQENRLAHQLQLEKFDQTAGVMADVTQRRDTQHAEIIDRLNRHNEQIEELTKKIALASIQTEMRGDITRLIFLATGISADVKALIPKSEIEPGEGKQPVPESSDVESSKPEKPK